MAQPAGTGLFAPLGATVEVALLDESGNAMLIKCLATNVPSSVAGYAIGCLCIFTDTGVLYCNTGTASSCTFVKVSST